MVMAPGEYFAGYRIIGVLGSGGMGTVYRVTHPRLDRDEALKTIIPQHGVGDVEERFRREARAAAGLRHPGIVTIHEFDVTDGVPWYTMTYLQGHDLAKAAGRLPAPEVAEIVDRVASALDYAHARGVVHRDVKPANVIVTRTAGGTLESVVVVDFGIAKDIALTSSLTLPYAPIGSPPYMAPEIIRGEPASPDSDQYSLAVTAFQVLTGHTPFTGTTGELMAAHATEPPPSITRYRPDLAALDPVLRRALAKSPAERFFNCGEFAAALAGALATASHPTLIPGPTPSPLPNPSSPQSVVPSFAAPIRKSRRRLLVAALVLAVVAATATAAGIVWHRGEQHPIQRADWHLPNPPGVAAGSWTAISAASDASLRSTGTTVCGIADGKVYCWGTDNSRAQLGNGRLGGATGTGLVAGQKDGSQAHALSVGSDYSCAIIGPSRKVSCWGTGPLNLPDKEKRDDQGPITDAVSISTSPYRACAALGNGEVQCWGSTAQLIAPYGKMKPASDRAVQITRFPRSRLVHTALRKTCVVAETGTVTCHGLTEAGAPIDDLADYKPFPPQIVGLGDVTGLAAADQGNTWCATTTESVYCWGHGLDGLVGNGQSALGPFSPTKLDVLAKPTSISGSMGYFCAAADGGAYCWGGDYSDTGRLGLPPGQYYVPTRVAGLSKVTSVTTGISFACAIADGERYCWGKPPKA